MFDTSSRIHFRKPILLIFMCNAQFFEDSNAETLRAVVKHLACRRTFCFSLTNLCELNYWQPIAYHTCISNAQLVAIELDPC